MDRKLPGLIESQYLDEETLKIIFKTAVQMEKNPPIDSLKGKIMVALFYEPSTRTRLSFESAMNMLGGKVIGTENAKEFSSKSKGETLEDTVRVVSGYGHVIILRYYKEGGAKRAQQYSSVPVINAGDGTGQHPTQALLDLFTIQKKFESLDGLTIAMMGDLANGRTVRSLCYLLAKHHPRVKIAFLSPTLTRMKEDIKRYLSEKQVEWSEGDTLNSVIEKADVFYQTRVQKERFNDNQADYSRITEEASRLIITEEVANRMKPEAIIMHPLPRVNEISYMVDRNPRACYFDQAQNGVYIRMALLQMTLLGY